jgi:pseudooxynicotine oxidase
MIPARVGRSAPQFDVVVIGGGFAGMTVARNLSRDAEVLVLEARDRLGGRTWTASYGGVPVDLGGKWIHWFQPHVFAEATRYGVELIESPAASRCFWRTSDAGGESPFADVWEDVIVGAKAFWSESAGLMPRPHDPLFTEAIASVDQLSVRDRLDALTQLTDIQRERLATLLSLCCSSDISQAGYATMIHWYALSGWDVQLLFDTTFRYKPRGGTVVLLDGIAADSSAEVGLTSRVTHVRHDGAGADIHIAGGATYRARAVVVAVPLNVLADIEFDPPLPSGKRSAADEKQASRGFNSFVRLRGDWSGVAMMGRPDDRIAFMNAEFQTDEGTVFFAAGRDASVVDVTDSRDVAAAVQELAPSAEVVDVFGHNWLSDPFTKGTWGVFRPRQLTRTLRDLQAPHGRLVFAGSDTAGGWNGFIDGAIESGHRATRQVRTLLASP